MMKKLLSTTSLIEFEGVSLLLLRLTFGGLMLVNHGLGKMHKLFSGNEIKFPDPLGVGAELSLGLTVFGEVACSALLLVGFLTRFAALPAIITMLVAAFIVHGADPFADKEAALLFLIPYIIIFVKGGGKYSVDAALFNK